MTVFYGLRNFQKHSLISSPYLVILLPQNPILLDKAPDIHFTSQTEATHP